MRIYMAGVYQSGRRAHIGMTSIHMLLSRKYRYPWLLESFHYTNDSTVRAIREQQQTIFLDSGAFSMFMQGVKVDLRQYANFILGTQDIIHVASNLDVIGEGHERESYERQKLLEQYLGEMKNQVKPVHHVRDADDWLQRYIDEGYDYIFLGGMVPESTPVLLHWLDHVWHRYLTNADGTAKLKVHGFGLTTIPLMFRYPWYSVDSTRWVMVSRFGGMFIDDVPQPDGSIRDCMIDFSSRSPQKHYQDSRHFWSLKPHSRKLIEGRLEELEAQRIKDDPEVEALFEQELGCKMGYNSQALSKSYGLRDIGNMEYFRRVMDRRVDRFIRLQETLFD